MDAVAPTRPRACTLSAQQQLHWDILRWANSAGFCDSVYKLFDMIKASYHQQICV